METAHSRESQREQVRLHVQIIRVVAADLTEQAQRTQGHDGFTSALRALTDQLEVVIGFCTAPQPSDSLAVDGDVMKSSAQLSSQSDAALAAMGNGSDSVREGSQPPGEGFQCADKQQERLLALFDELHSADNGGPVCVRSLRRQARSAALEDTVEQLLKALKRGDDDVVQRREWQHLVASSTGETRVSFNHVVQQGRGKDAQGRKSAKTIPRRGHRLLMLHPLGAIRASWDMLIALLLLYIAISLPYAIGFIKDETDGSGRATKRVDKIIDIVLWLDIVVNFRTGYVRSNGTEIMDWKLAAMHYAKSWFLLDLTSSIPVEGILGRLEGLKLMKSVKVVRCFKIFKLSKFKRIFSSDTMAVIEDHIGTGTAKRRFNLLGLFGTTLLLCHWMACCMAFSGDGFLDAYSVDLNGDPARRYLAALYWAMTTITTVGYGDILPVTDSERVFAMVGMVIGGTFYGYVIGNISALVSTSNHQQDAMNRRMEMISDWCEYHHFRTSLRRRILSYFRSYLSTTVAVDEGEIMKDLPVELRVEVAGLLVPDLVRYNPLFRDVPASAIARLSPILHKVSFKAGGHIVDEGEVGTGMFFLLSGAATVAKATGDPCAKSHLQPADSFGEEVLLGIDDQYSYSVVAAEDATTALLLEEKDFAEAFETMPAIFQRICRNYTGAGSEEVLRPPVSEDAVGGKLDTILQHVRSMAETERDHAREMRAKYSSTDTAGSNLAFLHACIDSRTPSCGAFPNGVTDGGSWANGAPHRPATESHADPPLSARPSGPQDFSATPERAVALAAHSEGILRDAAVGTAGKSRPPRMCAL